MTRGNRSREAMGGRSDAAIQELNGERRHRSGALASATALQASAPAGEDEHQERIGERWATRGWFIYLVWRPAARLDGFY